MLISKWITCGEREPGQAQVNETGVLCRRVERVSKGEEVNQLKRVTKVKRELIRVAIRFDLRPLPL